MTTYARDVLEYFDKHPAELAKGGDGHPILMCARCLLDDRKGWPAATVTDGQALCLQHALSTRQHDHVGGLEPLHKDAAALASHLEVDHGIAPALHEENVSAHAEAHAR